MYIKQHAQLEFKINKYYPMLALNQRPILYIVMFFYNGFSYIYRSGVEEFIKKLKTFYKDGMSFEMIELSMDNKNNLAYISESYDSSTKEITAEINQLIELGSTIELCHRNFIGYTIMTQENLFYLLLKWEQLVNKQVPYILIYLDDKDRYDVLSFETQEAMEQFVADHTKKE